MSGNVAEWCQDWYGKYSSLSQTNPTGSVQGTSRVVRGGDGYGFDIECQNSYRANSIFQELCTPNYRQFNRGLRLVLTAK